MNKPFRVGGGALFDGAHRSDFISTADLRALRGDALA